MPEIDLAYLPVVGRGEQINIICSIHGIKVNAMMSKPMGEDFDYRAEFEKIDYVSLKKDLILLIKSILTLMFQGHSIGKVIDCLQKKLNFG